jgi:hypothetical protein
VFGLSSPKVNLMGRPSVPVLLHYTTFNCLEEETEGCW